MEFHRIKERYEGLLTALELKNLNELSDRGNDLVNDLSKELTFELLEKLIINYIKFVGKNKKLIEGVIERLLNATPQLSVQVNEIISNSQELLLVLNRARNLESEKEGIISNLNKFLGKKFGLKINVSVNYINGRTKPGKNKVIIGFDEINVFVFVKNAFESYKDYFDNKGLSDEIKIDFEVINKFIKGLNDESLRLAINEDPSHADFLMKFYVVLKEQVRKIKSLVNLVNSKSICDNEQELSANVSLIKAELKKACVDLKQAIILLPKARERKVITDHLISLYSETKLIENPEELINAYLRVNFEFDDLINNLLYDFFVTHYSVPDELNKYNDFRNRSKYLFMSKLF